MAVQLAEVRDLSVDIAPEEALRLLGYGGRLPRREDSKRLVEAQIALGYRLVQPQSVYAVLSARLSPGGRIAFDGARESCLGVVAERWVGLQYWALAVCTIGRALEDEVARLFAAGEYSAALALDSVGSVAVESLADRVNGLICHWSLSHGLVSTPRLSPGYGDWPLQGQKAVFDCLPAGKIGVSLNEQYTMEPRKSISFGVGIGDGLSKGVPLKRCQHCGMADCPYRGKK
ncbi:MAG: hypothetical protein Q8O76_04840 [Chloroflexota bacterium]|nr:hypothetical protein [Chloroflexota bacterium]